MQTYEVKPLNNLMKYAQWYYNRKAYVPTISILDNVTKHYPNSSQAYNLRALAKCANGQYIGSIIDLNTAIKIDPDSDLLFQNRSTVHLENFHYPEAIADINIALSLNPRRKYPLFLKGVAQLNLGLREEALSNLAVAARVCRYNDQVIFNFGIALEENHYYKDAIDQYSRAIYLNDKVDRYYYQRACLNRILNNLQDAIADFTVVIDINKYHYEAHYYRGMCYEEIYQDNDSIIKALLDYQFLIDNAPKNNPFYDEVLELIDNIHKQIN